MSLGELPSRLGIGDVALPVLLAALS